MSDHEHDNPPATGGETANGPKKSGRSGDGRSGDNLAGDRGRSDNKGEAYKAGVVEGQGKEGESGRLGSGFFKGIATLSSMGITLVVSTFLGLVIGIYIDRYLSTSPWFTLIFLVLGIVSGFRNIYLIAKKYGL